MTKKINNKSVLIAAIIGGSLFQTQAALAELYISPVVRDTVTFYNHDARSNQASSHQSHAYPTHAFPAHSGNAKMSHDDGIQAHPLHRGETGYAPRNHPAPRMIHSTQHQGYGPQAVMPQHGLHLPASSAGHHYMGHHGVQYQVPAVPVHPAAYGQAISETSPGIHSGRSSVHGDFTMNRRGGDHLRFGSNVPLFVALENIVPNSKSWNINIDDGLENIAVSWDGGDSWEGALKALEEQNKLSIAINHEDMSIGLSRTSDVAIALASRQKLLWRMEMGKSLRENIASWAGEAGWELYWDQEVSLVDFPVVADAAFKGTLIGAGGVIDRVIRTTKEVPLVADFYHGNKVIHIHKAGYEQEVKF